MYSLFRFGFVFIFCGVAACTTTSTTPTSPSSAQESSAALASAANVIWTLRSLTDESGRSVPLPDDAIFTIALADGRINIQSDCNRCNGSAALDANSLDVGPLACTRAFCASAPVDNRFVTALQGRHNAVVNNSRLTLTSDRGVLVFDR